MPRYRFRRFDQGLWVRSPRDLFPEGALRRTKGIRNTGLHYTIRSRWGTFPVESFGAQPVHSIVAWHRRRYYGVGTVFGLPGLGLWGDLNGLKLTFASGVPTTGQGTTEGSSRREHLFVAGGGALFKADETNVATHWGLEGPQTGMTAGNLSFQAGVNFMFWERFDRAAGDYTHAAPIEGFRSETENLPPDRYSPRAIRFTLDPQKIGSVAGVMRTDDGTTTVRDFRVFDDGNNGGAYAHPSSPQDWIVLDVYCDHPERLDSIELRFGWINDTGFTSWTHTRQIIADDEIVRQASTAPEGISDFPSVEGDEEGFVDHGASSPFVKQAAESLSVTRLSPHGYTWTRLKIPKSSFTITELPDDQEPWQRLDIWQVEVATNKKGSVEIVLDNGSMFGGTGMQGTYQYHTTFLNEGTGSRSNPYWEVGVEIDHPWRTGVLLSSLPQPIDPQITHIEIWRTLGNGSAFFYVDKVPVGTTTFEDHVADYRGMHELSPGLADIPSTGVVVENGIVQLDVLGTTALTFDNIPPRNTCRSVFGPHLGRLFLCRDTEPGALGRLYYSVAGRLEAFPDFLEVTGDDDPLMQGVIWGGTAYLFSVSKVFELIGEGPFIVREVFGVPGSPYPFSVQPTPYGVVYLARDGVRVFNGSLSELVAPDGVLPLFRGEDLAGLASFPQSTNPEDVCSAYHLDEYWITDKSATYAVNLRSGTWRETGTYFSALYAEKDTALLVVGRSGSVMLWEYPGATTDDGAAIPLLIQVPAVIPDAGKNEYIVQRLYFDVDTRGQTLLAYLYETENDAAIQGGPYTLSTLARQTVEVALCSPVAVGYVEFRGNLTDEVEIFGVEMDLHLPEQPGQGT